MERAIALSAAVLLASGGLARADLIDNVIGYWALNETSGATASDELDTYDGSISGNPTLGVPGKLGTAYDFDNDGDFITVSPGVPIANQDFSLSFWVNRDGTGEDWVIGHSTGGNNNALHVGFRDNNTFAFAFWGNDLNIDDGMFNDTAAWMHFVCTYDASSNVQTVYANVEGGASGTWTRTAGADFQGTGDFYIGKRRNDTGGQEFDGLIDEVGVWDRVLSAAEAAELYNGGAGTWFFPQSTGDTYVWDGDTDNWANASHWTGGPAPPPQIRTATTADDAEINSGAVTVATDQGAFSLDVTGTASLTIGNGSTPASLTLLDRIDVAPTATFSIADNGKLVTADASLVGVNTSGTATIDTSGNATASHLITAAGSTFVKQGDGTLSFDQSAAPNAVDPTSTVQVAQGELWMQALSTTDNPLGGADLALDGGMFTVQGAVTAINNTLKHSGFDFNQDSQLDLSGSGGLLAATPWGVTELTDGPGGRGLDFNNDADFQNAGVIPPDRNDNYMNLFFGDFHAPETGTYQFRVPNEDDRGEMWIDLDRNGTFEAGEEIISDGNHSAVNVDLDASQTYMFAVTHREGGGGSRIDAEYKLPSMAGLEYIKPADAAQANLWSYDALGAIDMTDSDVFVSADSTINTITEQTAAFGTLTFTTAATLTTTGGKGTSFASTDLSAVAAAGFLTETDTNPGPMGSGASPVTITKSGPAALVVNQPATLASGSMFDVEDGDLAVVADPNPIGSTPVQLDGGGLALSIASGSAGDGGSETFDLPVEVVSDSRLAAGQWANGLAGPKTAVLGSGTHGITLTGGWLRVSTTDDYTLVLDGSITGPGGIQFLDGADVVISQPNTPGMVGIQPGANVDGLLTNLQPTGAYYFDPTPANPVLTLNSNLGSNGADAAAEVHIGNDDTVDGWVALGAVNTYTGKTRVARSVLQADEGVGLPTVSLLEFDSNTNDQVAVLETSGTFTRDIGSAAGQVRWNNGGGFAARGGDLTVTLEGGAQLDWGDADAGFNGATVQFGSQTADGMVELTNSVDLGNATRRFQVANNSSTKTDFVRLTGDLTSTGADNDDQLRFNENGGNNFSSGLIELLGTNTYAHKTRIDDVTVYAIEGEGLPSQSNIYFGGNSDDREAVFMTSGTLERNIGNNAGEVSWDADRGGFAARGGSLTVTLEGGSQLTWGSNSTGFDGHTLQLGSQYADDVVTLTNAIELGNATRKIQVADNPDTKADYVRLTGNLTSTGADNDDQLRFNENGGTSFRGGLIELLGTNTYAQRTRIDDVTVYAIEGTGLPANSLIWFSGNSDDREAILMSNGVMEREIGRNAGEVSWDDQRGGFAARGGTFTITLESGNDLSWGGRDNGFDGKRLQFGSRYADNVVTLTNNIDGNDADRYVHVFGNPDVETDWAVMSGDLTNFNDFRLRGYAGNATGGDGLLVLEGILEVTDDLEVYEGPRLRLDLTSTFRIQDDVNIEDGSLVEILGTIERLGTGGDDDINVRRGSRLVIGAGAVGTDFDEFNVEDDSTALIQGTLRFDQGDIFIDDNSHVEVSGMLYAETDFDVEDGSSLTVSGTGHVQADDDLEFRRGGSLTAGVNSTLTVFDDILFEFSATGDIQGAVARSGSEGDDDINVNDDSMLTVGSATTLEDFDDLGVRRGSTMELSGTFQTTQGDADVNVEDDATFRVTSTGVMTDIDDFNVRRGSLTEIAGSVTLKTGDQDVNVEDNATLIVTGLLNNQGDDINVRRGATLVTSGDVRVANDMFIEDGGVLAVNDNGNPGTFSLTVADDLRVQNGFGSTLTGDGRLYVNDELDIQNHAFVAPGQSVGMLSVEFDTSITSDDRGFRMENGSTYQWEISTTGNDLIAIVGDLRMDNRWTLEVNDLGAFPDPAAEYNLFTYTGDIFSTPTSGDEITSVDFATGAGTYGPAWDFSGASVRYELDFQPGLNRVYVTGLSSSMLTWDGHDGVWSDIAHSPNSHWLKGTTPTPDIPDAGMAGRVTSGKATVMNAGQAALGLVIDGGEVEIAPTGELAVTESVEVGAAGTFNVHGRLNVPVLSTAGTTAFHTGATIGPMTELNVTGGTMESGASFEAAAVNVAAGSMALHSGATLTTSALDVSHGGYVHADSGYVHVQEGGTMSLHETNGLYTNTYEATSGSFRAGGMIDGNRPEMLVLGGPGSVITIDNDRGRILTADVGNPGQPGTFDEDPTGTYTIEGGGGDIWGNADQFHFAYQAFDGDGEMIARVSDPENTNGWAKAGLMYRETLDAGSKNTFIARTPTTGENRITFQNRSATDGGSGSTHENGFTADLYWLRIEREGDTFRGFWAPDVSGAPGAWTQMGPDQTVAMGNDVLLGMAVTSHNNGTLSTVMFDNVTGFLLGDVASTVNHVTGDGTIASPGGLHVAGALSPGDSVGQTNIQGGDLTLESTASYLVEIAGKTPGTEHDQTVVEEGALYLENTSSPDDGPVLEVFTTPSGAFQFGDEVVIIDAMEGTGSVDGRFYDAAGSLLDEGDIVMDHTRGWSWRISYAGGDVSLSLNGVPEPGTLVLLAIGAAAVAGLARRRLRTGATRGAPRP